MMRRLSHVACSRSARRKQPSDSNNRRRPMIRADHRLARFSATLAIIKIIQCRRLSCSSMRRRSQTEASSIVQLAATQIAEQKVAQAAARVKSRP